MTERATLIWHWDVTDTPNRDWIRFLLSDVIQDEIIDLEGRICRPYSIVVEDNRSKTPTAFFEAAARQRPIGLFHVFDEYFGFDYNKYHNFDFVIKNYWSSVFEMDGILVAPIGYTSDLPFRKDLIPASQRPLLWSFAGALKSSRHDMVRALRDAEPNVVHAVSSRGQRLSRQQYFDLLESAVFSPCPMGNVSMESWRLYESLEAGCIPIVEKRPFLSYYQKLLNDPPFIFVWNWKEAERKMLSLVDGRDELDHLQRNIHGWWKQHKNILKEHVTTLVTEGFSRRVDPCAEGVRVKGIAGMPGWRYAELIRHQSPLALLRRVRRNLLGGGRLKVPF